MPKNSVTRKNKFTFDRSKNIDFSIQEQRAYEYLLRLQEAKLWVQEMIQEALPEGTINFGETLRDGVFLATLAHVFDEKSTAKIHKPKVGSVLEFMATDNIAQFFKACDRVSFPKIYMFSLPDLWELKNVYKVVLCIHALANFLSARGKAVKIKNLSNAGIQFDEEEMKRSKEELKKLEESDSSALMIPISQPEEEGEESEEDELDLADPDQCELEGEGLDIATAGVPCKFEIIAKDADAIELQVGGETFNVVLFLESDKKVKIKGQVTDQENGRYLVEYTPVKSGTYSMEVQLIEFLDDEEEEEEEREEGQSPEDKKKSLEEKEHEAYLVKGCPRTVVVAPAPISEIKYCQVEGSGSSTAVAGVATTFTLVSKDSYQNVGAGGEFFEAKLVSTSSGDNVDIEIKDNQNGTYCMHYVCPTSGSYELKIKLKDQEEYIPNLKPILVKDAGVSSPEKCSLSEVNQFTNIKAGENISFEIQAKDSFGNLRSSGGENFSVKLVDAETGAVEKEATVEDTNEGKYLVHLTPEKSGKFQIKTYLNENEISSLGFECNVADTGITIPENCTVAEEESYFRKVKAGETSKIVVEARDQFGNLRDSASEVFIPSVISKKSMDHLPEDKFNIEALGSGRYVITYQLTEAAEYAIVVLHKEGETTKTISGFPCDASVSEAGKTDAAQTIVDGELETRATNNQMASFVIRTRDKYGNLRAQGGDKVQVTLVNSKRKLQFSADVNDLTDGSYDIRYNPKTVGEFQVRIQINDEDVPEEVLAKLGLETIIVEPQDTKQLTDEEINVIHDHDLMSSLVQSFHIETDNENLVERIAQTREKLIRLVRSNNDIEENNRDTERKIELIVANKQLSEEIVLAKGKRKRNQTIIVQGYDKTTHSLDILETYSHLFYLLQTQPNYVANILFHVPEADINSFITTVIFGLFGFAFSPREEYLLLSLFKQTMTLEMEHTKKFDEFLEYTPILTNMIVTYGRRLQGTNFLKTVYEKYTSTLIENKELNFDLDAIKYLRDRVNKEEVETGVKSTINIQSLTYEQAMEDEDTAKTIKERSEQLVTALKNLLTVLLENIEVIPYGLRWLCLQAYKLGKQKYPKISDRELYGVINWYLFYRFLNPTITAPDAFQLTPANVRISEKARRSLTNLVKVLNFITNFLGVNEQQYQLIKEQVAEIQKDFEVIFCKKLLQVEELEEFLGVDQYSELVLKQNPTIDIKHKQLFNTCALLKKIKDKLKLPEKDPLIEIIAKLEAPESMAEDESNIKLILQNASLKESIEKANQLTPLQIYDQVKDAYRIILKGIPADALGETVTETLKIASETVQKLNLSTSTDPKYKNVAETVKSKLDFINSQLQVLEEAGIISQSNNYRQLLIDITKELQNQKNVRARQKKQLEKLNDALKIAEEQNKYLQERQKEWEEYIDDCRRRHFQIGTEGKRSKSKKKAEGESFKFSYKTLLEKGVIAKFEAPFKSKFKFVITMTKPGVFEVEARLAKTPVASVTLELGDLLDRQSKAQPNYVVNEELQLNVNMTLHMLHKLFTK